MSNRASDDEKTEVLVDYSKYWQESRKAVQGFNDKWLSKFLLRPIIAKTTLHSMKSKYDNEDSQIKCLRKDAESNFANRKVHHSAVEITLSSDESYLIFPNFQMGMVQESRRKKMRKMKKYEFGIVTMSLSAETEHAELDKSEFNLFGKNYGFINRVQISPHNEITISVTNKGIYDRLFLNNAEFFSKSILPTEILRMIFNEYMSFTHNEVQSFTIAPPIMRSSENIPFEWICHRLEKSSKRSQRITLHHGMNIIGKYYTLITNIEVGHYPDCYRVAARKDELIGTNV